MCTAAVLWLWKSTATVGRKLFHNGERYSGADVHLGAGRGLQGCWGERTVCRWQGTGYKEQSCRGEVPKKAKLPQREEVQRFTEARNWQSSCQLPQHARCTLSMKDMSFILSGTGQREINVVGHPQCGCLSTRLSVYCIPFTSIRCHSLPTLVEYSMRYSSHDGYLSNATRSFTLRNLCLCCLAEYQAVVARRCGQIAVWGVGMGRGMLHELSTARAICCANTFSTCHTICSWCCSTSDFTVSLAPWSTRRQPLQPRKLDIRAEVTTHTSLWARLVLSVVRLHR